MAYSLDTLIMDILLGIGFFGAIFLVFGWLLSTVIRDVLLIIAKFEEPSSAATANMQSNND